MIDSCGKCKKMWLEEELQIHYIYIRNALTKVYLCQNCSEKVPNDSKI
jgi:uncharacterized protein YlaI